MSNGKNSSKNPSENPNDIFEEIERENQKQSLYLNLTDGEIRKLQFSADGDKIEIVPKVFDGKPTKRVQYKVVDPDRPDDGEKILSMALSNARLISGFMKRGKNTLEIHRIGSGRNTRYNISAI